MPTGTADPDRIRRIRRESVFARVSDPSVLATYPSAKDGFAAVRESLFDNVADAQALLTELSGALCVSRGSEALESDTPLGIGSDIDIVPTLPKAHLTDRTIGLDSIQIVKSVAVDYHTERNAIATIG
jgi:hypothetical protein